MIDWLKEELAQHRRRPSDLFAPPAPPPPAKDGAVLADADADANDKRSWMSSVQLWSCGSHDDSTANTNGAAAAHKVRSAGVSRQKTCRIFIKRDKTKRIVFA